MRRGRWLAAIALVTLACKRDQPTGIVVEFSSEYAVPSEINRLDVQVIDVATGKSSSREIGLAPPSTYQLPARMLLEPSGGAGTVRVVARGVLVAGDGPQTVVTRAATVSFAPGRVLHLVLPLVKLCAGKTCIKEGETCLETGACDGDQQLALPDFKAGSPFADAGGSPPPPARDAGAETPAVSPADAAGVDAPEAGAPAPDSARPEDGPPAPPPDATVAADAAPDAAPLPSPCPAPASCNGFETATATNPGPYWDVTDNMPGEIEVGPDDKFGFRSRRSMKIRVTRESQDGFLYHALDGALRDEYYGRVMIYAGDEAAALPLVEWRLVHSNGPVPSLSQSDETPNYTVSVAGDQLLSTYDTPAASCTAPGGALPTRRWFCLEWHFRGLGPEMNALEFWVDGQPRSSVINRGGSCREGPQTVWEAPTFSNILIGYLGGPSLEVKPHDFWLDDLAFSPGRIGCAAP